MNNKEITYTIKIMQNVRKSRRLLVLFVLTVLAMPYHVSAQYNYEYIARLNKTNYSGFHKIVLTPELMGKLRGNHTDIRLYNDSNREIPYLLDREPALEQVTLFNEYEITEKNFQEDEISYLIFHNKDKKVIDNISVVVQNTDVRKRARLSGSNDQENWYVIKNDYLLHSMYSNSKTSELKILNFPLSDYEYFKLEINDYWKLPINILTVGYYDYQQQKGKRQEFEATTIQQKDSAKVSYVTITFPEERYLEHIRFDVDGADYYLRNTALMVKGYYQEKKQKRKYYFQTIKQFDLNSNSINEIKIGPRKVKEIYLQIQNNDDQPVKIKQATASFLKKYMIADLSHQESYRLMFGDEEAATPRYDLGYFTAKIPDDIATVQHQEITFRKKEPVAQKEDPAFYENKIVIWGALGLVGIVLVLVSFRMVKEIGPRN